MTAAILKFELGLPKEAVMEVEYIDIEDPRFIRFMQEYNALRRELVWKNNQGASREVCNFIFI